jgi:hypothetical protein
MKADGTPELPPHDYVSILICSTVLIINGVACFVTTNVPALLFLSRKMYI